MEYATILEKLQLNYTVLKGKFLRTSKPYIENRPDALDDLKSYYSSVINSARTSDYINNLESLLGILEKRNELSYENIKPLIHIEARYVRSPELGTLLRNYEENMHDYPVVPLFNVYDLYSGEYRIGNRNISESTSPIEFALVKNNQLINRTNHEKKIYRDKINVEAVSEILGTKTSTEEAIFFDDTHFFSSHNSTSDVCDSYRCNIDDINAYIAKTRWRTAKWATITLLLTSLMAAILIICLIILSNAQSSEQSYESQQGYTSGVQSNAQSAGGSSLQDPMTIYSTTLSSFHLTIPAPVQITSLPNSNNEDSRIATIVFLEVSDKLGRHWRDVARFLGVTEHDIDDIDYQPQLPLKEKALKAFTKFQSKSDPLEWKPRLQRALEKARRRDLMEMVEKLLSQQHRSA